MSAKLKWKGWHSASVSGQYRVQFDGIAHEGDGNPWKLPINSERWTARKAAGCRYGSHGTIMSVHPTREAAKQACERHHGEAQCG